MPHSAVTGKYVVAVEEEIELKLFSSVGFGKISEEIKMSLQDGKEYTAYCVQERVNLGGWVSYRSDAEANRDQHLDGQSAHQVQIRVRDNGDVGPGTVIG